MFLVYSFCVYTFTIGFYMFVMQNLYAMILFLQKDFGYEIKNLISFDSRTFACCPISVLSPIFIVR